MVGKKAQQTRQRILSCSLDLFNLQGESSITTNAIAEELDISPGNLHYHFQRKADIVTSLFEEFCDKMHATLELAPDGGFDLEGFWWFQHLLFDTIGHYRFVFRDVNTLLERYPQLQKNFDKLMQQERVVAAKLLLALREQDILILNDHQMSTLVESLVVTLTYWLSFRRQSRKSLEMEAEDITEGIYQMISLVAPWMREPERSQTLAHAELYK